jgi:hypothetical protein
MPKFLVETVSMFRHRYVIECENIDHAKDAVVMNEADEFGQEHIDENIFSCREITDAEIPELFFQDHPYLREWGPSKAMEYVYKVNYEGNDHE